MEPSVLSQVLGLIAIAAVCIAGRSLGRRHARGVVVEEFLRTPEGRAVWARFTSRVLHNDSIGNTPVWIDFSFDEASDGR